MYFKFFYGIGYELLFKSVKGKENNQQITKGT